MSNLTIKKRDLQSIGFWLVTVGLFFFPRCMRLGITGEDIGALNLLPFLGGFLIVIRNRGIKINAYLTIILLYGLMFITEMHAGLAKPAMMLTILVNFSMPIILISLSSYEIDKKWIARFVHLMNIAVYVTLLFGLIDILTNRPIGRAFAQFSNDSFFISLANSNSGRLFTWYGHYIYTGEIFLIFYLINIVYHRELKKEKESIITFILSLFGILLVGSKTCTALILIAFIVLNVKKLRYIIAGVLVITAFYYLGIFDILIARLLGTDLSTGRSESLSYLFSIDANIFPLLIGNGTDYLSYLKGIYSNASAGLEYVIFMFTAYFGVAFTVIMYYWCFVKQIIEFVRKKSYIILICFIALTLDVNSYNGLAVFQDQMWAFCWAAGMMKVIQNASHKELE